MQHFDASRLPADAARDAAEWIRSQWSGARLGECQPRVGIILGSGLNELLHNADIKLTLDYRDIPYFGPTSVVGHTGVLEMGTSQGQQIAVLRGRYHLYEGHSPDHLALPVRVLHELGVDSLIVTNAAGGLNPAFRQGDLMIMRDHIGLPTLAGQHPLIGPNDDALGPRFPSMGAAYDSEMIQDVLNVAQKRSVRVQEGIYIMVSGPTYETPAEMRALRRLGADAVGMSTVPEVIAARHAGMRVLGISCISNQATPKTASAVNHEEVLLGAAVTVPKLDLLLDGLLEEMSRKARQMASTSPKFSVVFDESDQLDALCDPPTGASDEPRRAGSRSTAAHQHAPH